MTLSDKLHAGLAIACLLSLPFVWRYWPRLIAWFDGTPDEEADWPQPVWSGIDGMTLLTFGDSDPVLVPDDDLFEVAGALAWIDSLPEVGDEVAA